MKEYPDLRQYGEKELDELNRWIEDEKKRRREEQAKLLEEERKKKAGVYLKQARDDLRWAESLRGRGWKVEPPSASVRPEFWDDCETCGRRSILGGGECSRCADGN